MSIHCTPSDILCMSFISRPAVVGMVVSLELGNTNFHVSSSGYLLQVDNLPALNVLRNEQIHVYMYTCAY